MAAARQIPQSQYYALQASTSNGKRKGFHGTVPRASDGRFCHNVRKNDGHFDRDCFEQGEPGVNIARFEEKLLEAAKTDPRKATQLAAHEGVLK
jgi:hypothetical protein